MPRDYRVFGRATWFEVSEQKTEEIKKAVLNIQNVCLPTLSQLRNLKNLSQLQERVLFGMKKYENEFNKCILKARTPE